MKKALLYVFLFIAIQVGLAFCADVVLKMFWPDHSLESPKTMLWFTAATSAITGILFAITKWTPISRDYIRSRPWVTMIWTILLAIGIVLPLSWAEELLPAAWRTSEEIEMMTKMLKLPEGYFILCMLVPLVEEMVFRGAVITELKKWLAAKPNSQLSTLNFQLIIISALFFAAVHMNLAQMPHAFVMGCLLGWLYVRTGSIVPGLLVHWINNTASYVFIMMFPQIPADAELSAYFGGSQMAVAQAVIASLLIAIPSFYQVYLRTKNK